MRQTPTVAYAHVAFISWLKYHAKSWQNLKYLLCFIGFFFQESLQSDYEKRIYKLKQDWKEKVIALHI